MGITEKDILKTVLKVPQLEEQLESIKLNKADTTEINRLDRDITETRKTTIDTIKPDDVDNILCFDGFERENGSLGTLEIGGLWKYGGTGNWKIDGGRATVNGQTNYALAYTSIGNSDCTIESDVFNTQSAEKMGVAFRIVDENNFFFVSTYLTSIGIYRCNNGNITLFKAVDLKTINFTDGKITIVLRGDNIKVFYDNFLQIDIDLSIGNTSVQHGIVVGSTSQNAYFDNFKITKDNTTRLQYNAELKCDNTPNKWHWWYEKDTSKPYSQQFINNELRVELRKTDNLVAGSYRSEIRLPNEQNLESHIYQFDIKLSDVDGEFDKDKSPEILFQCHASANQDGSNFSAPLSLMARDGELIIDINWDDYYKTSNEQITSKGNNAVINLGKYELGKWYSFKFKVKWGWHKELKPMLEVYKDNILVCNRPYLPNCMNNAKGIYFKVGVYKYDWKNPTSQSTTSKRVVFYKNIKVI